jgi:putative N6-adenine-specific DNA methylase
MLNPPYGERIAPKGQGERRAGAHYARARTVRGRRAVRRPSSARWPAHWKRHYSGWTAWCLSPEMKLPSLMRLKESRRVPMWNGPSNAGCSAST